MAGLEAAGGASGAIGGDSAGAIAGRRPVDWRAWATVAGTVLVLSSTAAAAKYAVRELPVGLMALARFGTAGLILAPFALRGGALGRMLRQDGVRLALASAFCVPINQWFFLSGVKLAPTAHVGLIYAACPLVVLLLAAALGQERLNGPRVVGVLLSVAGVGLIALENLGRATAEAAQVLRGDLLEVVAVLAWGAYLTVNKPLVARHGALPVLAATFLLGALLDLPVVAATYRTWPPLGSVSPAAWLGLLYLATVISVGGLAFQNMAMRTFDASQVATFGNVAPLLTIAWGGLLFDERLAPVALVGGGLVLLGILSASRPARRAVAAATPGPIAPPTPHRRVEPAPAGG